jgi:hypothetical protein
MAIVKVQSATIDSSGYVVAKDFTSTTTAGNLILVGVRIGDTGITSTAVTDNVGNTYTKAKEQFQSGNATGYIFYAKNAAAATTITVTVTGGSSPTNRFCIYEYSGCDTTAPFDVAVSAAQTATTTPNSGSVSTNFADALLFAVVGVSNGKTVTAGTNVAWAIQDNVPNSSSCKIATETFTTTSSGSYQANFNLSGSDDCVSLMAAFKQASSAPVYGFSRLLTGVGV